ncbi:uncharacterized protein LOC119092498 [Pollicipes pollicipes]|uniref:uncharacterized protein LOC119092498 n=1 Tax=Pollicipes pollicipes TaxID=41117 RepID=UPI0018851289|nr:uncharacterized protein LOC119092498 [Pollicipes pollicipes]
MAPCKTELLPLRVMLFAFYGGIGCVLPFVTLHLSTLGLTAADQSWLQLVLPFVSCAGPLLGGPLADRMGSYKPLLVASLLVCAAAYPCLLLVPPVERLPPRSPELFLSCGPRGSMIGSELCVDGCSDGDTEARAYHVLDCAYRCEGAGRITQCEVLDAGGGLVLNASLPRRLPRAGEPACWYPLVDFRRAGESYRSLVCGRVSGCRLRCAVRQLSEPPLFGPELCRETVGDPGFTLWLYFGLRAATEALLALALVLVNATTLLLRRRHDSDYGREALWALLGLATFAPVCGYVLDVQGEVAGRPDFRPSMCAFSALMLVCVVLASVVPVRPGFPSDCRQYWRLLAKNVFNCEFFGVVCALVLLGVFWGFLETFLYGHVRGLGGSQLQNGLSLTAGTLVLLPFLLRAEALVAYCGHHHVFIVAFIIYIVRYVSYAYITEPWLVLVAESLEMFTLHLAWMAAVLFASDRGRPVVEASLQAVITAAHYGIGRGVAAGVVQYALPLSSSFLLLCAGSVLAAVAATLYLVLYHCCRALRTDRRAYNKRQLYNSGGAMLNGPHSSQSRR